MTFRILMLRHALAVTLLLPIIQQNYAADQGAADSAVREIKVLGIGNSFTGNAFALLRPMGSSSEKCRIVLGEANIGGCPMEKHMRLAQLHEANPEDPDGMPYSITRANEAGKSVRVRFGLREVLASNQWDIVTIQQLSAQSPDLPNYRPYAKQLYDYIKKYAPQAEVVMHQTWAYRTDGDFDRVFSKRTDYDQAAMYRDLDHAYNTIAKELGVRLIPVGAAFQLARQNRPYVPDTSTDPKSLTPPALPNDRNSLCAGWYWDRSDPRQLRCDTHHAGEQGKYLAAAVWFEFLTGSNPRAEGIQVGSLDDADVDFLADIAHRVVTKGERPAILHEVPAAR